MALINVQNKKDLITVDLRTSQIRYVHGQDIKFFSLSHDDVWGYESLFESDKNLFLKSLIEDVYNNLGIKLNKKDLKIKR
jgi:hypothetical protein